MDWYLKRKAPIAWLACALLCAACAAPKKEVPIEAVDTAAEPAAATKAQGSGAKLPLRWKSFPQTVYVSTEIAENPKAMADVHAAMDFWSEKAGVELFRSGGKWSGSLPPWEGKIETPASVGGNVIFIPEEWQWSKAAGRTYLWGGRGEAWAGAILLSPKADFCYGDCGGETFGTVSFQILVAHELGHFIGLPHRKEEESVMFESLPAVGGVKALGFSEDASDELHKILPPAAP